MSVAVPQNCAAINDLLTRESGRIGPEISRLGLFKAPILRFMDQGQWPDEMGNVITTEIVQRSGAATEADWQNVGISDGASVDGCDTNFETVGFAIDQQTFQRQRLDIKSETICLSDLRSSNKPGAKVQSYVKGLADWVNYRLIRRFTDEYIRVAEHKVSVTTGLPEDDAAFPATEPTSMMTLGALRQWWEYLYQDAAGEDGDAVDDLGRPVFQVFAGNSTMENMIANNDDVRQDIRWSSRVTELLGSNGHFLAGKGYGGFTFHSNPFPPRYNDDGAGGYTQVLPFAAEAATKGTKLEVSAAWRAAKYEVTIIFHPRVMKVLSPDTNLKYPGINYGPQNFRGDFQWINEFHQDCNPFRDKGWWQARLELATQPDQTRWGVAFLHLRCDVPSELVACSAGSGYLSA